MKVCEIVLKNEREDLILFCGGENILVDDNRLVVRENCRVF